MPNTVNLPVISFNGRYSGRRKPSHYFWAKHSAGDSKKIHIYEDFLYGKIEGGYDFRHYVAECDGRIRLFKDNRNELELKAGDEVPYYARFNISSICSKCEGMIYNYEHNVETGVIKGV